jgi:hypothetical protein
MELETIKSKLKKIASLAERGVGGEKENARRLLDVLLSKHGLRIEDVTGAEQETQAYWFKATKAEEAMLIQCYARATNRATVTFWRGKGFREGEIRIDLTKLEALELRAMWDHFGPLFRQERRKLLARHRKERKLLMDAFASKHNLYRAGSDGDDGEGSGEALSREDLLRLMRLRADLEDTNYVGTRRMIEG